MKKILMAISILILSFLITFYQINKIKIETLQIFEQVVLINKNLKAGMVIKESDLEYGKINKLWHSTNYYTQKEALIGKTILIDYGKNGILSSQLVADTVDEKMLTDRKNAMTALKLLPEEALCWSVAKGDYVNIFHIDSLYEINLMGNALIKAVYDGQLDNQTIPAYILIEADSETILNIIKFRESGRFEIVRMEV